MPLILGIETSCDETAAAVVDSGRRVVSNVIASQHDLHAEYGGVVPELASRAHAERILPVVRRAVSEAGVTLDALDAVAVGNRPGLIGSLLIGVAAAKALAWSLGKPLVGVDHLHAHLYSGLLEPHLTAPHATRSHSPLAPDEASSPAPGGGGVTRSVTEGVASSYPALGLVVSGGHTALYLCRSPIDIEFLGATIDDAMGEAFDKAATILGLPYPGGPNLDRLARTPGADDRAFDLPVSRLARDSLDFSFSGLKTAVLYAARGVPGEGGRYPDHPPLDDRRRADLAASFQRAAVRAVTLKLERAIDRLAAEGVTPRVLLAGGGVISNSHLRAELAGFCARAGVHAVLPPPEYCVDNAAMIAGLAHHLLEAGRAADLALTAFPSAAQT